MDCCLAHSLQNAATRFTDRVAVIHSRDPSCDALVSYTFQRLWSSVEILSKSLPEAGLPPKDATVPRMGILIPQSAEYLVAVGAISKVKAAFVPLDPSWPLKRILAVTKDAGCTLIIGCYQPDWSPPGYQRTFDEVCQASGCIQIQMTECNKMEDSINSKLSWSCRELPFSYIMYTSGSSGKPRGVCGTQKGLLNRLRWMENTYPYLPSEVACFKTSIGFIDHLTESFGPLLAGTTLVVCLGVRDNPLQLVKVLETCKITRLTAVPSLIKAILPALELSSSAKTLRVLVSSGESLPVRLLLRLRDVMPETIILNLYGSTEISGDCTCFDCGQFSKHILHLKSVPVGKAISGSTVFLDNPSEDMPGELYVGGVGLASGYWNDPSSTSFGDIKGHGRMFKTGDLARRLENGDLVITGRKDRFLKVRGQRIEPQEVEIRLEEHVQIQRAAVCTVASSDDDVQLVAYVTMNDNKEDTCSETSLKEWIMSELPLYMVPERIIFLPAMPLTESGKVDYVSLQNMDVIRKHESSIIPASKSLQNVIQAFSEVLSVEDISPVDDFFLLGGTSISAAHVAHKLGIDMRLLVKYRSAVQLTDAMNLVHGQDVEVSRSVSRDEPSQCSCQKRKRPRISMDHNPSGWPHGLQFGTSAFGRGLHVSSPISFSLPSNSSWSLQRAWKHCLHACVDASPLLVMTNSSYRVYIGSHAHKFFCLDASSGEIQWETTMGDRVESTATITRDFSQVVVGCYDGNIYFVDANDGKVRWKFQTDGEVKCQPFVDPWQGLVWCGSHDHTLYVLDPVSRVCVWRHTFDGSIFASPVADDVAKHVYVATTNGTLMLIDTMPSYHIAWEHSSEAPIFGAPVIVTSANSGDSNMKLRANKFCAVIFGRVDGYVSALSSTGSLLWKAKTGGPIFSTIGVSRALKDQALVSSRDGNVYSYHPATGELLWKYNVGEPIVAGVGIDEITQLFDADESHTRRLVCVCGTSGTIYVMRVRSNPTNGSSQEACEIAATIKLSGELFSSPLILGRRVFVGCRDDNIYCFDLV